MTYNPKSIANPAIRAEERVQAYELKLLGKSLRAIGQEMGCSHEKVRELIAEECDSRVLPLVAQYRQQTLDRLEIAIEKVMAELSNGKSVARNAEVLGKLEERISKMLGGDAAEKHQIDANVSTVAPELQAAIDAAKAQNEAVKQQYRED